VFRVVVVVVGGGGGGGVGVGVCVGVTPAAFYLGSVVAENRQICSVLACFCNSLVVVCCSVLLCVDVCCCVLLCVVVCCCVLLCVVVFLCVVVCCCVLLGVVACCCLLLVVVVVLVVVVDDDNDDVVLAVVVVVGGSGGGGGGVTPAAFFLGSVVAENRQIGGVFACFCNSRSKKHRKYQCFWRVGSPKPRYLRCVLPLVAKSTVFTVFFGQHLAKTLVFTEVSPCNKMWFLNPKRTKIL